MLLPGRMGAAHIAAFSIVRFPPVAQGKARSTLTADSVEKHPFASAEVAISNPAQAPF